MRRYPLGVLVLLVAALSLGGSDAASECLTKPAVSLSQSTSGLLRLMINIPSDSQLLRSISFDLAGCPELNLKSHAFPSPNATSSQEAEPFARSSGGAWRTYRTSSSGCDTVNIFAESPLLSILKCFVIVDSGPKSENVSLIARRGLATLSREYTDESLRFSSVVDKFILNITIQEIYAGMQAHVAHPTITERSLLLLQGPLTPGLTHSFSAAAGSDFVAVASHISGDMLIGNSRKWNVIISTKTKYPFELRTNAANGLAGVALVPTGPWTHGEISLDSRCDGGNVICEQLLVLEVVSKPCEFMREYINVPNAALKYGCIAGSSAATQCPLASDAVSITGVFAPAPSPLSIVLDSGSICSLIDGASFKALPSITVQLRSVAGLSRNAGSWDPNDDRSLVLLEPNTQLSFSLEIASDSVVQSVRIVGFAPAFPSAAEFNVSWVEHTSDTTNCSKSVQRPGVGWMYYMCIQVSMTGLESLFPSGSTIASTSLSFTANVTIALAGDLSFDASSSGSVVIERQIFSATSVGVAAAIVIIGVISLSVTMIKFYRDQVRISTSRLSRKIQHEYATVVETSMSSPNGDAEDYEL